MKRSGRVILVDFSGRYALLGKRKRWHRDARRKTKFRRMPVTRRGWVSKAALGSAMVAASICGAWVAWDLFVWRARAGEGIILGGATIGLCALGLFAIGEVFRIQVGSVCRRNLPPR